MKLKNLNSKVFLLLVTVLFTFAGCGGSDSSSGPTTSDTYTVLVYMVGSNLESEGDAATTDLQEMMQVGSTSNLNVIVITGGANKDGWRTVQRHKVNQNSIATLSDLGSLDMGEADTLGDFITWGISNYPADHYALILWDHGGGAIGGFGNDENTGDKLDLAEIAQALTSAKTQTGVTFDLIGFDACLMATIETANTLAPHSQYLVASEEIEPGSGWDYTAILNALKSNTSMTPPALGKRIVDSYSASLPGNPAITLSLLDLSKVGAIVSAIDSLSQVIDGNLSVEDINNRNDWLSVSDARSKAEDYGNDKAKGQFTDMADLKHLASLLASNGTYQTEANALISAIDDAVTYKISGSARPHSNGLSIYFPNHSSYDTEYDNVDFSSTYRNMLKTYAGLNIADTVAPTFTSIGLSGNTVSTQILGNDVGSENVSAVLTTSDPNTGNVTILGMVPPDSFDSSGNVTFVWDGYWLALVSWNSWVDAPVFVIAQEGSTYLLDIPALLNGQIVDLLFTLDTDTGVSTVIGGWPGIDDSGMAVRDILPIQGGDIVIPLYLSYDLASNSYFFAQGNSLTVQNGEIELSLFVLPDGTYYVGFYAVDYSGNDAVSDFAQFTVSSGLPKRIPTRPINPQELKTIMGEIHSHSGIRTSLLSVQPEK